MRSRRAATVALTLALALTFCVLGALGPLRPLGPSGVGSPDVARADGDPASDVLVSQDVFLPYSGISATLQRRLFALCAAAQQAGYAVKVALIASPNDLGVVPALFNRPQAYARFLSAELGSVVPSPVLVVMPSGVGLAAQGRALSTAALTAAGRSATGSSGAGRSTAGLGRGAPDSLANAAIAAVPRLAAAAGHPLPASGAAAPAQSSGASPATVRHALIALLVLGLMAAAAITAAFVARSRRAAG